MGGSATSYVQGDTGFKLWPLQGKWSFKLCTTPYQDLIYVLHLAKTTKGNHITRERESQELENI